MIIVPHGTFIKGKVLVADLQHELVHGTGEMHEAVQFVEDGQGVDLLAGGVRVVHWWRERV